MAKPCRSRTSASRGRFVPSALLLLSGCVALLHSVAFLGCSAPGSSSSSKASVARPRRQISQRVPRSSATSLTARGGDEDEDGEDDYEFAGGEINIAALKIGQKLDAVVVNIRDFGAFVDFGADKQGLVPRSKVADGFVENIEDHVKVGDSLPVWVSDLKDGKITLSMTQSKIYGRGQGPRADLGLFAGLGDEDWMTGTVVRVAPFGAFVQVQAPSSEEMAQGLVHVSQMAEGRVEDPATVVAVGDEVKVRVVQVDAAANKLSLSMKDKSAGGGGGGGRADLSAFEAVSDDEWLEGTVKSIVNFGAFVEVAPPSGGASAQGLLHLSQIRDGFVEDAGEELEIDQEVKVRVLRTDTAKGKMDLSMKPKEGQAEVQAEAQEA